MRSKSAHVRLANEADTNCGGYSIVYVTYNPVNYHWHLIIRSFRTLLTTYN
jgi:hypothetical protein